MRPPCVAAKCIIGILFVTAFAVTGAARAEFLLVDDFESLELGSINGQSGWYTSSATSQVVTLPDEGTNQSLRAVATPAVIHKSMTIEQGDVRMLFLRFRFEGQHNYSFGMSHLTSPDEYSDFGPELRKRAAFDRFSIHDGERYEDLISLEPATWYNLWVLVDNVAGTSQVWLNSRFREDAVDTDQLIVDGQTTFNFRTNANTDLVNFYIKAADGGSGNDPLWIDDIYLENTSSRNLTNPVPEPGMLIGTAALILYGFVRRRRAM